MHFSEHPIFIYCFYFLSIQGVQGAIPEGPEPIPELINIQKMKIFKLFQLFMSDPGIDFYLDPKNRNNSGKTENNSEKVQKKRKKSYENVCIDKNLQRTACAASAAALAALYVG